MQLNRSKELYKEYNNRQAIIKNNADIAKKVYNDLRLIKSNLNEKTVELVNVYSPGLLDVLDSPETPSMEDLMKIKESLKFVYNKLCDIAESELG